MNENEPYAAQWLRNLWPDATVDERSVLDVQPGDLAGYERVHLFAGIGGWEYALQLAGWPEDESVWTGSCPCQPFSSAARGRNKRDDLWPQFRRLIVSNRPRTIFGEQVASSRMWADTVCNDLEAMGYAVGTAILPACSIGLDHVRYRFYFVGHSDGNSESIVQLDAEMAGVQKDRGFTRLMAATNGVSSRVGRLRAYGNAIVPQVAAVFVRAYMEAIVTCPGPRGGDDASRARPSRGVRESGPAASPEQETTCLPS